MTEKHEISFIKFKEEKILPEMHDSREDVLKAFNESYKLFNDVLDEKAPPNMRAYRRIISEGKKLSIDQGRDSFINSFTDQSTGNVVHSQEHVPVDVLIDFLAQRIYSDKFSKEQKEQYIKYSKILYRNSLEYSRSVENLSDDQKKSRTQQEAYFISIDRDRSTGNANDDWKKAAHELSMRRVLILPKEEKIRLPAERLATDLIPQLKKEKEVSPKKKKRKRTVLHPAQIELPEVINISAPANNLNVEVTSNALVVLDPPPARKEIIIVNRTADRKKRAEEIAELALRDELKKPVKRIFNRLVEHGLRKKYTERAEGLMEATDTTYLNTYLAMDAIKHRDYKDRYLSNGDETQIHEAKDKAAGDAKVVQIKEGFTIKGDHVEEVRGELRKDIIREIVFPVFSGTVTSEKDVQKKLRKLIKDYPDDPQVQAVFASHGALGVDSGDVFATNLLETTGQIKKDYITSSGTVRDIDESIKIKLADTNWRADSHDKPKKTGKFIAWAQEHKLTGGIFNPAVIGAAASTLAEGVIASAAGGVYAGFRHDHDLSVDSDAHKIERTNGMQVPVGAKRRRKIEQFSYDVVSSEVLLGRDQKANNNKGDRPGVAELLRLGNDDTVEQQDELFSRIAEINERIDYSAENNIDLISFPDEHRIEQARLELLRTGLKLNKKLYDSGLPRGYVDRKLEKYRKKWNDYFSGNQKEKDKALKSYKLKSALRMGTFAAIVGAATSPLTQQVIAEGSRAVDYAPTSGQTLIEKYSHINSKTESSQPVKMLPPFQTESIITMKSTLTTKIVNEISTPVDGWQWYADNTEKPDGNELGLSMIRESDMSVTFTMKPLEKKSWQKGNNPMLIKVPELVDQDGYFAFWKSEDINNPIFVKAKNGSLRLDKDQWSEELETAGKGEELVLVPNAKIANIVLGNNINSDLNFNVSLGTIIYTPDNRKSFGSLATILGKGKAPQEIIVPERTTFYIPQPPVATVIKEKENKGSAPLIPLPFAPRLPLERLFKRKSKKT